MNAFAFSLLGQPLHALPCGALWWPARRLLCVSDLHLGKSDRIARRHGAMLPPYDSRDTLARLRAVIEATDPATLICLGDSFDDLASVAALSAEDRAGLVDLASGGRDWIWVEGNHDPGPHGLPGRGLAEIALGPLTFRHIAEPGASGEISGHYHPKARLALRGTSVSRPCFLIDAARVILPAFGTYTGGLCCTSAILDATMAPDALAVLTGQAARAVPMPRAPAAAPYRRIG